MAKNNRINEWNENEMFSLIKIAQDVLNAGSIKTQYIKTSCCSIQQKLLQARAVSIQNQLSYRYRNSKINQVLFKYLKRPVQTSCDLIKSSAKE